MNTELFPNSDHFEAVRVGETVIINVYLPTGYRDDCSEMKFALACKELGKCMNKISSSHLQRDFNCDISKSESSRSALLLSLIPNGNALVPKAGDFTYIHPTGSVSNLDHALVSSSIFSSSLTVDVLREFFVSDHLPLSFRISASFYRIRANRPLKWRTIIEWSKTDLTQDQYWLDNLLSKIKIPFDLLQTSVPIPTSEIRLKLNMYSSLISHALLQAESHFVPRSRVRAGSQVKGCSRNPSLVEACQKAKFWLGIWIECGRPKNGIVNQIRNSTKRHFFKELQKHRAAIRFDFSEKIMSNPTLLWKSLSRNKSERNAPSAHICAEARQQHFLKEFSEPDSKVEYPLKCDLNRTLKKDCTHVYCSLSDIMNSAQKIKKPFSRCTDNICAKYILLGSPLLFCHLDLMFKMVFTTRIVPTSFSFGRLTLAPKKISLNECSSRRPITIATTFCKIFETLVMPELTDKC